MQTTLPNEIDAAAEKPLLCFVVVWNDGEDSRVMFRRHSITAKRDLANETGYELSGISARRAPEWDHYAETGVPALARIDREWWYECEGCGTRISSHFIGSHDRFEDGLHEWHMRREYGPDISRPVMDPVEPVQGEVWCCSACHTQDMARRRRRRRWEERIHAWLVRRLSARLPADAVPLPLPEAKHGRCSVYGSDRESYVYVGPGKRVYDRVQAPDRVYNSHVIRGHGVFEADIRFEWPGAKYGPASLRIYDERNIGRPRRAQFMVAGGDQEAFHAWAEASSDQPLGPAPRSGVARAIKP